MGGIVTAWGLVMTCHGFVRNFQELCGVRVLLGLFEWVLVGKDHRDHADTSTEPVSSRGRFYSFPSGKSCCDRLYLSHDVQTATDAEPNIYTEQLTSYLLNSRYLPGESQTRIAIFFTASAIAGAFSGLLAFGIANMDGVGGYEGWRWVNIPLRPTLQALLIRFPDLHPRGNRFSRGWCRVLLAPCRYTQTLKQVALSR